MIGPLPISQRTSFMVIRKSLTKNIQQRKWITVGEVLVNLLKHLFGQNDHAHLSMMWRFTSWPCDVRRSSSLVPRSDFRAVSCLVRKFYNIKCWSMVCDSLLFYFFYVFLHWRLLSDFDPWCSSTFLLRRFLQRFFARFFRQDLEPKVVVTFKH